MKSRVVPATLLTIARLRPRIAFISDDFPAFGAPAITARMPSWISESYFEVSASRAISAHAFSAISQSLFVSEGGRSSSGKSM